MVVASGMQVKDSSWSGQRDQSPRAGAATGSVFTVVTNPSAERRHHCVRNGAVTKTSIQNAVLSLAMTETGLPVFLFSGASSRW